MKWRNYPADVLPLWVAEMDVDLAPPVEEAIVRAAREGDTGYAWGSGYAEAIGRFAESRWAWPDFPVGRTALVPDVMMGIVEALRLVTEPGDQVVVNPPVYPPFYAFVEHAGRQIVDVPLSAGGRLDLAALEAAFAGRPAAYLLCNPQNPTGTVHTAAELTAVAGLADRYGVRVIVDEIHGPLVLAGATYVPYLSVAGAGNAFTLASASKGWNLAGLKAAVLVAGAGAAADLARLPEEVSHGPSHVGVLAGTAAFNEGGPWLDALLKGLDANRSLLDRLVADLPGVTWRLPQATYLAWLDFTASRLAGGDSSGRGDVTSLGGPTAVLLERGRVALSPGPAFGPGGVDHARLNYGTSAGIVTEALSRIEKVLREIAPL
jgi:cysteine-S-conjugate beta-lyase